MEHSFRKGPALAAGLGLLVMTGLGPFALLSLGHAEPQAGALGWAVLALLVVAALDMVVAWGLFEVSRSSGREGLARLAAWLRLGYAIMLALLAIDLAPAPDLLASRPIEAAALIGRFEAGFALALGFFGLHLLVLGGALRGVPGLPSWLALLVGLAGLSYLADAFGPLIWDRYRIMLATYFFVGEVLLMGWLFYRVLFNRP